MAANTSELVINPSFPLDTEIRFVYEGNTRQGTIRHTTANTVLIETSVVDRSPGCHRQFTIEKMRTVQHWV